MDCKTIQTRLGALLDGEASAQERSVLEAHLGTCESCKAELEQLQLMVGRLHTYRRQTDVAPPPQLWSSIQGKLTPRARQRKVLPAVLVFFRRPVAVAASLGILLGLGVFLNVWLGQGAPTASAGTIDYSVLLDGVEKDIEGSFQRFIGYYRGRQIDPDTASAAAPDLRFALPHEMAGGYRLDQAYALQFGVSPGIAASYRSENNLMIVFFHPPVDRDRLGVHKEMPCVVGNHYGHRVDVGPWKLVHFTDPTTCHCVLSTLDVESELPAVFAAVAPDFAAIPGGHGHHP
jgi:hypothetical protein